jgi:hypothetical protein
MQTVVDRTRVPNSIWDRVLGTDKLLLVSEGEVVAGFDMAKVGQRDVSASGDRITLILPEPEVLYSRLDNERTYVYEHKTGVFRRPDKDIETEARYIAEQAMVEHALEGGILHQAEGNGRLLIAAFLRSLGFTDITIVVRTAY